MSSPRTDRYFVTCGTSVVVQLIVAGLMWLGAQTRDYRASLAECVGLYALCGVALLCALDGIHGVPTRSQIFAGALAIYPAYVLLSFLVILVQARYTS